MKLRKSQKIYSEILNDRVLDQKTVKPLHAEQPCNFGKTELIVNYNIPETIKKYKNEKIIHLCSTIMANPYDTFGERVESQWSDNNGVWFNENANALDMLLQNPRMYLKAYTNIVVLTTLNKMFGQSQNKFDNLLKIATEEYGFKICHNRDEGDYAGQHSDEHKSFESGV